LLKSEYGAIQVNIHFHTLAAYVWYLATRTPVTEKLDSPLIGVHNGIAYYFLYNGILGDRRPQAAMS